MTSETGSDASGAVKASSSAKPRKETVRSFTIEISKVMIPFNSRLTEFLLMSLILMVLKQSKKNKAKWMLPSTSIAAHHFTRDARRYAAFWLLKCVLLSFHANMPRHLHLL